MNETSPATANAKPKQPRTAAQQRAARENGARSRGPRTRAGRRRSRGNALKHGAYAQTLRLWVDDPGDRRAFDRLVAGLRQQYGPATPLEHELVDQLADELHRYRWLREMESARLVGEAGPETGEPTDTTRTWDRLAELDAALATLEHVLEAPAAGEDPLDQGAGSQGAVDADAAEDLAEALLAAFAEPATEAWAEGVRPQVSAAAEYFTELTEDAGTLAAWLAGRTAVPAEQADAWGRLLEAAEQVFAGQAEALRRTLRHERQQRRSEEASRLADLGAVHRQTTAVWRRVESLMNRLDARVQAGAAAGPRPELSMLHRVQPPLPSEIPAAAK